MLISSILEETPTGFRDSGYTYVPKKLLFGLPYGRFSLLVFLLQRANWDRKSKDYGRFYFRDSLEFISQRYLYSTLKTFVEEGITGPITKKKGVFSGRICARNFGHKRGSIPLNNLFLCEAITSETAFIFGKISVFKWLNSGRSNTELRRKMATDFRAIRSNFWGNHGTECPEFSAIFPSGWGILGGIEAGEGPVKSLERSGINEADSKAVIPDSSEPKRKIMSTEAQNPETEVQPSRGVTNIKEGIKVSNKNLNVAISETQVRKTYRIPTRDEERLRSILNSIPLKMELSPSEIAFSISVAHCLFLTQLRGKPQDYCLKMAISCLWYCRNRGGEAKTKSCLWSRVYAYAKFNHGQWLWDEYEKKAGTIPTLERNRTPKFSEETRNYRQSFLGEPPKIERLGKGYSDQEAFAEYMVKQHPGALKEGRVMAFPEVEKYWKLWQKTTVGAKRYPSSTPLGTASV